MNNKLTNQASTRWIYIDLTGSVNIKEPLLVIRETFAIWIIQALVQFTSTSQA